METNKRNKRKRISANRRMMAWSNGQRVNIIPSVFRKVDDYGSLMRYYHWRIDEGYLINYGTCSTARDEAEIREYEADREWTQGNHLNALNEMLRAALFVLPEDEDDPVFEDFQWLNPWETINWHPNIRKFLHLIRRCREYCRQDPRLWPILEGDISYKKYKKYLNDLSRWRYDTGC